MGAGSTTGLAGKSGFEGSAAAGGVSSGSVAAGADSGAASASAGSDTNCAPAERLKPASPARHSTKILEPGPAKLIVATFNNNDATAPESDFKLFSSLVSTGHARQL